MTDPVNHPPHYKGNGIEVIDVIEKFDLGFRLGNAIKYILRAGKKGEALEDLSKARWYLDREIEQMKPTPWTGLAEGKVEKGGLNVWPSQVVSRPPPPQPSNKPPDAACKAMVEVRT